MLIEDMWYYRYTKLEQRTYISSKLRDKILCIRKFLGYIKFVLTKDSLNLNKLIISVVEVVGDCFRFTPLLRWRLLYHCCHSLLVFPLLLHHYQEMCMKLKFTKLDGCSKSILSRAWMKMVWFLPNGVVVSFDIYFQMNVLLPSIVLEFDG